MKKEYKQCQYFSGRDRAELENRAGRADRASHAGRSDRRSSPPGRGKGWVKKSGEQGAGSKDRALQLIYIL